MICTCQWCGLSGTEDDFELDTVNNDGFWCPDCDGHSFFDPERNRHRRVLLLLENPDAEIPKAEKLPIKLKKHLSPLRYPGGKSRIIDCLAARFHQDQMDTFVEVFAGGASVGLSLLEAGLIKKLVINDTDAGVYSFWDSVVNHPEDLLDRLENIVPDKTMYKTCQEILKDPSDWCKEELAWAMLVCNRLSFSGIVRANSMGGKDGTTEQLLCRWNPKTLEQRIRLIHSMRDRIEVSRIDAVDLIENSAYWDDKATLFIDPPYVMKGKDLYLEYYDEEDHANLAWMIRTLYQGMPGADIVITYDDCPFIRNEYFFADVEVIGRKYSI